MLRSSASVRVLAQRDLPEVLALLRREPVEDVFVASRVHAGGVEPWRLGAELWGYGDRFGLQALCFYGANLVPVQASPAAASAFAERAAATGRRCSSIVGPASVVHQLWERLEPVWGPAREVRSDQPLMAISTAPQVPVDPAVRLVQPHEVSALMPACVAMFTEEVGISPLLGDGGVLYRARVTELVRSKRAWARFDGDKVVFKAEVGASTGAVCQVQGVWVHPSMRGQGIGQAGTAAVVEQAQSVIAPTVSLYVNDFNAVARRTYERVGFARVGTFASVLF